MSDIETNKAIVRRYFEMFNSGDLSQLAAIVSKDYGDKLEGQSSGIAVIRSGEFKTVDEVVFGRPGDLALLGARTLEGFNASVDPRRTRLIAVGPIPAAAS